jgi:hypothetical protein
VKIRACKCERHWLLKRSSEILSSIIFATLLARLLGRPDDYSVYLGTTYSHLPSSPPTDIKSLGNTQCLTCPSGRDGQIVFIMDEAVY